MKHELPEGVITFLFTDVEGSTRLFEEAPDTMLEAMRQHDETIEEVVTSNGGVVVRPRGEGDSRFIVFDNARHAVVGAAEMQRRLATVDWATPKPLQVRAALHTGVADLRSGDYYGSAVNRAARLRGIAHGGQTLMSRSTWELVQDELPDGLTVIDLGEHSLKDLTRPERVFQLSPDGLPDKFRPLESLNNVPNNLPEQLTEFVGRQSELVNVKRLIGKTRLLTILAPGGAGKTRLAIQVAADISADFADGVFFVGFADISSTADIVQTIAESLGLALSSDEDIRTQLLTYLAPRRQLLVLDNLEHLTGAVGIVEEILRVAPHVKVVATSRSKLKLTGETVLALEGLEVTWNHPDEALKTSGVQLFNEAAKRSDSSFILNPTDLDALAKILHLVGGMPLGILLASAWVDMLSIAEIAAEISNSFDFLETEMRDIPDRQRSIRAVFEYSWNLLRPEEKETFCALSVFRGGFSREAAKTVAGASLRGIANLANKSLVTASPDTGRYKIHELLRQYAEAKLRRDNQRYSRVCDAHATYFATLMGECPFMMAHGQQASLLEMVQGDIENIRIAWRYHVSNRNIEESRKFILGLFLIYEFRGWYQAARTLFNEALDLLPDESSDEGLMELRALISAVNGWYLTMLSQPKAGWLASAKPTELLAQSEGIVDYFVAVQCLALSLAYLGNVDEMATTLDEAISHCNSLEEAFWGASLRDWRAFAAVLGGDFETATECIDEAIQTVGSAEEYWVTIWNVWLRAMIATYEDRPEDAIKLYAQLLTICRKVSYVRGMLVSMDGLGEANLAAGRIADAEIAFIEAMANASQLGMVRDVLSMMTKVARIRMQQSRPVEAVELLATVLAEPNSVHQPFTDTVPINEAASAALNALEEELDAEAYASAIARGSGRSYDLVARELIDSI